MSLVAPTELSSTIRTLAAQVGPTVVGVNGRGCGIVIGTGLIVTNTHNLDGPEAEIDLGDGNVVTGTVAGADLDGDIAVLRADTGEIAPLDDAEGGVEIGDVVFGISRPRGGALRVTVGTVSSLGRAFRGPRGRRITGGVEHTAPLPRGSSGGPVVDASGRLVGLNTHRVEDGFYLALPAGEEFRRFIDQALTGELASRRSLGIAVVPPAAARRLRLAVGLSPIEAPLVRAVEEGGPAARAGIRRGDVIIGVGAATITSVDELHTALVGAPNSLSLRVVRGSDEVEIIVEFESESGTKGEV